MKALKVLRSPLIWVLAPISTGVGIIILDANLGFPERNDKYIERQIQENTPDINAESAQEIASAFETDMHEPFDFLRDTALSPLETITGGGLEYEVEDSPTYMPYGAMK